MSRSSKSDSEKLSVVLAPVRCSPTEKAEIKRKAREADMSMSEYIRHMSLRGKLIIRQSKTDFDTLYELRRIGVNLNQQTKKLNAKGNLSRDLITVLRKLDALLTQMMKDF